jgi:hypothetical protein
VIEGDNGVRMQYARPSDQVMASMERTYA